MIVGIDLSLTGTGVAVYRGGPAEPQVDTFTIDGAKTRGFPRVADVCSRIWKVLDDPHCLVVLEGYSYNSKGDRNFTGLAELRGVLTYGIWSYSIQMMDVPPANLKQFATGKGNAGKDEVLLAVARRYGMTVVANNNEADALVLVAMACHRYGCPLTPVPERNAAAVAGTRAPLSWPVFHPHEKRPDVWR